MKTEGTEGPTNEGIAQLRVAVVNSRVAQREVHLNVWDNLNRIQLN